MKNLATKSQLRSETVTLSPVVAEIPQLLEKAKEKIEEYQKNTKVKVDKTRNISKYETGQLVMRMKQVLDNKLEQRMWGPYRVVEISKTRKANITIENPYVGKDSQEVHHTNELLPYKGKLDPIRMLTLADELNEDDLTAKQRKMLDMAQKKIEGEWSLIKLIGRRIKVYWSQAAIKNYLSGKIVDYEPALKKFWVKYDEPMSDGTEHYPEALLGPNPPKWEIID